MSTPLTLSRRILRHTPRALIVDTWPVLLAAIMIGIGLATVAALVLPDQTSVIGRSLPNLGLRIFWSFSFIAGGIGQLYGLLRSRRDPEQFGMIMCLLGCLAYGLTLLGSYLASERVPTLIFAVVFIAFALGYFIRILVSNTARAERETR